jgi:hypothetical protein
VNALVPSNVATGLQQVVVTAAADASAGYSIAVSATEPRLLAPASFKVGGKQYVVALFTDGATYVLPAGAISGVASRPANTGDTIVLYGVGFGAVVPNMPAGRLVQATNTLAATFLISIGVFWPRRLIPGSRRDTRALSIQRGGAERPGRQRVASDIHAGRRQRDANIVYRGWELICPAAIPSRL